MKLLIQPINKKFWENAAITIKKIGYPKNLIVIDELLKWLQDMNWPGASVIIEIMKDIPKEKVIIHIKKALIDAKINEDYMWIGSLKRLITDLEILKNDFNDNDVYEIINLADW